MTNENLKQIKVTYRNNKPELYIDGLIILDKINSVYYQDAIYRVRNNEIVTSIGKYSIVSLVERGHLVYYLG